MPVALGSAPRALRIVYANACHHHNTLSRHAISDYQYPANQARAHMPKHKQLIDLKYNQLFTILYASSVPGNISAGYRSRYHPRYCSRYLPGYGHRYLSRYCSGYYPRYRPGYESNPIPDTVLNMGLDAHQIHSQILLWILVRIPFQILFRIWYGLNYHCRAGSSNTPNRTERSGSAPYIRITLLNCDGSIGGFMIPHYEPNMGLDTAPDTNQIRFKIPAWI